MECYKTYKTLKLSGAVSGTSSQFSLVAVSFNRPAKSSTDQQKLAGVYKFPQEIIERINYPPSTHLPEVSV